MNLKNFLEKKVMKYNQRHFIENDPISVPHRFSKKEDIEIAGFFAAILAWGNRTIIIRNANELMRRMDFAPHNFILEHTDTELKHFRKFTHRTFNGTDCIFFIRSLRSIYKKQTLESAFAGNTPKEAIMNFRKTFFKTPHLPRSEKHISNPAAGSPAKRLNMFLRWMVRKDSSGVDFGIWKNLPVKNLMCPLDVHSGNVARKLGLLSRKQNDWQAVEELTNRLREFDANDPAKYDFALFGMGAFKET